MEYKNARSRRDFNSQEHIDFMSQFIRCELCGSPRRLELHHIVPLCCGGTDNPDNWIAVCETCHSKLTPKRLLQKIGIERAKAAGVKFGRHPIQVPDNFDEVAKLNITGEITAVQAYTTLGLSRATYYRMLDQRGIK